MLDMTVPQLDFVLENYARDNPNKYTFHRPGVEPETPPTQAVAGWYNVLRGSALERFMAPRINQAVLNAKKARERIFGLRGKGKID